MPAMINCITVTSKESHPSDGNASVVSDDVRGLSLKNVDYQRDIAG